MKIRNQGFSLIELMTIILVLGIVCNFAVPYYLNLIKDANLEKSSKELLIVMSKARQKAIKNTTPVYIYPKSKDDNWNNGWIEYTNGATRDITISNKIKISSSNSLMALKFDSRGRVYNGKTNEILKEASFMFCDKKDTSIIGRKVTINFIGRIQTEFIKC